MLAVGSSYEQLLESRIKSKAPSIPMISSVKGEFISGPSQLNASYWRSNMESPVIFSTAMNKLIRSFPNDQVFLEVGPQGALGGPIRQILGTLERTKDKYISLLDRGKDCTRSVLKAVGSLYVCGPSINFNKIVQEGKVLTDLPLYQWSHDTEYWSESRIVKEWRFRQFPHHELLGSRTMESNDLQPEWRNVLRLRDVAWLQDHQVLDDIVFPLAGYIAMAGEALRRLTNCEEHTFQNIIVQRPLVLTDSKSIELVTNFRPVRLTISLDSTRWEFTILSHDGQIWTKHCTGEVSAGKSSNISMPTITHHPRHVSNHYFAFKQLGLQYGPFFQGLRNVSAAPAKMTASATIALPPISDSRYAVHPTIIDNCLQLLGIAASEGVFRRIPRLHLPVMLENLYISGKTSTTSPNIKAEAIAVPKSSGGFTGNLTAISDQDVIVYCDCAILRPAQDEILGEDVDSVAGAKLVWEPDLDFVDLSKLNRERFIDLVAHSNPIIRVLELDVDSTTETEDILTRLLHKQGHSMYSTYTYVSYSQEAIRTTQERFKGYERVAYQVLSPDSDLVDLGFADNSFGLIIVPQTYVAASPSLRLTCLRKMLHNRGWLLITASDSMDSESAVLLDDQIASEWNQNNDNIRFSLPRALSRDFQNSKHSFVARPFLVQPITKRITLLIPVGKHSAFTLEVQKYLQSRGTVVDLRTLHQGLPADQDILSLLDNETPFLENVSEADFLAFQNLIKELTTQALVWITRASQMAAPDPSFSSCLGLIRTLRQELSLPLATVELDCLDDSALTIIGKVLDKFQSRTSDEVLDPDYEFVLRDGIIHIGRFHPISVQNELSSVAQNTNNVTLNIGQPGLLQTLRWVAGDISEPEKHEVIIRTKAVGINFKVFRLPRRFKSIIYTIKC